MATVSVLNTSANLSGKTLLVAEQPATITGLQTFDRDPSAPFAVTANSAKVSNLDADKLDGEEASAFHDATQLTGIIPIANVIVAGDPNADRILFWDDSAGLVAFLAASTGLAITTTNLAVTTLPTAGMVGITTVALTDGATPALDASLGTTFRLAAAGDRTIAVPSNATAGQKIVIQHYASAGARTLALNSGAGGFRFGSDVTGLTQTASGKTDYIGAIYNDTDSKWDVVAYAKGY